MTHIEKQQDHEQTLALMDEMVSEYNTNNTGNLLNGVGSKKLPRNHIKALSRLFGYPLPSVLGVEVPNTPRE